MIIETRKNTPPKPKKPSPDWYNGVDPLSPDHEPPPKAFIDIGKNPDPLSVEQFAEFQRLVISKYKRLAYNAAYQRDLRTIKRQGLNMTVKEWREKNER